MKKIISILVIILLAVGVSGCSFSGKQECEKCPECNIDSITDIASAKERFDNFVKKLKKTRDKRGSSSQEQVYYLYNADSHPSSRFFSYVEVGIDGIATIYFEYSTLKDAYPNGYKVADNVLYAIQVEYGNGGYYDIVFITEDGNPLVLDGASIWEDNQVKVKKAKNDNIISAIEYGFISGPSGASRYYVIDIDGNAEELQY